jgi:hypothetical protein
MPDREVMQQALDALTCTGEDDDPGHRCGHCDDYVDRNGLVRAALRAALEQQAEPVAWVFAPNNELLWPSEVEVTNPIEIDSYQPLYAAPTQRKPLTDDMVHRAMIALNTASCGDLQPTFEEMKSALEAAHGIGEKP